MNGCNHNCRSLRYFLSGFGLRVMTRLPAFTALLVWVILSTYVASELARYALWWMPESFSQGAYIALIFATKWLLVLLAGFGLPAAIWAAALVFTRWFHTFPPCSSCKKEDCYRWIKPEMFGWEQGRIFRYHCGFCGDQFLRYQGRFFMLHDNLSIRPYQRSADGRHWEMDRDPMVPQVLLNAKRDAWQKWTA